MSYELSFERRFDAAPERVFDALTRPDGQKAMFDGDAPGTVFESECDLRVGGEWRVATGPSHEAMYRFVHVFRVIDRPHSLSFSVTEQAPDGPTYESDTDISLEDADGKTRLLYVQRFPTAELRDNHERGIAPAFDRLDAVIRAKDQL